LTANSLEVPESRVVTDLLLRGTGEDGWRPARDHSLSSSIVQPTQAAKRWLERYRSWVEARCNPPYWGGAASFLVALGSTCLTSTGGGKDVSGIPKDSFLGTGQRSLPLILHFCNVSHN
jgi:hypothetical protein